MGQGQSRGSSFDRSDYLVVYNAGGAAALNALLCERYRDLDIRAKELDRMEKSGLWQVAWDVEAGTAVVVRRLKN
jgi:hypothetical protein